jgi:putative endonuclease
VDLRKIFGTAGERKAERFLIQKGLKVIARNWRCALGEIDLIAMDGPDLVFVEVKTRASDAYGLPEAAVNAAKQRKLALLAEAYVGQTKFAGHWRIDVVALDRDGIRHVESAVWR